MLYCLSSMLSATEDSHCLCLSDLMVCCLCFSGWRLPVGLHRSDVQFPKEQLRALVSHEWKRRQRRHQRNSHLLQDEDRPIPVQGILLHLQNELGNQISDGGHHCGKMVGRTHYRQIYPQTKDLISANIFDRALSRVPPCSVGECFIKLNELVRYVS